MFYALCLLQMKGIKNMANDEKLINASKLASDISKSVSTLVAAECNTKWVYTKIKECLDNAPAVDARPVVHGTWLDYSTTMMECSVCKKHVARHRYKFCPECGATMRRT